MFKENKEGQTHYYGDGCIDDPHGAVEQKCEECLAHYTGEHECLGFMKVLVEFHKKNDEKHSPRKRIS